MNSLQKISLLLGALVVALSGCAAGPDFTRPAVPIAKSYATTELAPVVGETQKIVVNKDIPYEWWGVFQSPQLDALIKRALKANPNVEVAQSALRQAQEYTTAQQGFFYPTVTASYSPSRNKLAGNMGGNSPGVQGNGAVIQTYSNPAGPQYNGPAYYNFHVAQLSVGYVPDVFGVTRRHVESAKAQAEVLRMQLEATYLTLASNVVAAAIQEASLRAQIDAQKKIVSLNEEALTIMLKRQTLGDVSAWDVSQQKANVALSQQALIPLLQHLEQTRNLLRVLVGNTPDVDVSETFTLESLHLPEELPLTLPSKLVEQRPDVRIAEEQLHVASAQYGVAVANTLPQFAITGAIGGMAASPLWMFKTGGSFFNLTGNIAQTIFDGGSLRAQSRIAQESMNQAAAQYRSVVMTALQNVADALYVIQSDAQALQAASTAAQAVSEAGRVTQKQFDAGYVDYATLLMAKQNEQFATINLVQAQTNRLGDSASLFQALGGGWWNREKTNEAIKP